MRLGVALSGGGAKGIAHAGVLKALQDSNIEISAIGGTSSGAFIACMYALGYSPEEMYEIFKIYSKEMVEEEKKGKIGKINKIFNFKSTGFRKGENIEKIFNRLSEQKGIKNISQIQTLPISIPAVDIKDGKEYIFTNNISSDAKVYKKYITDIPIGKALRASSSFPALFCPCDFKEHKFLDGGALNNIPVLEVKRQGVDKVLAINFKADDITNSSNYMDIAMRTIDLMGNKISEKNLKMSDYVITLELEKMGLLEINKLEKCYEQGYYQTINKINEIKEIIE